MAQFSKAIELAVASFADLDSKQYKELAGRSTINLKKVVEPPVALYNCSSDLVEGKLSRQAYHHLIQHRRILTIKSCFFKFGKATDAVKRVRLA